MSVSVSEHIWQSRYIPLINCSCLIMLLFLIIFFPLLHLLQDSAALQIIFTVLRFIFFILNSKCKDTVIVRLFVTKGSIIGILSYSTREDNCSDSFVLQIKWFIFNIKSVKNKRVLSRELDYAGPELETKITTLPSLNTKA